MLCKLWFCAFMLFVIYMIPWSYLRLHLSCFWRFNEIIGSTTLLGLDVRLLSYFLLHLILSSCIVLLATKTQHFQLGSIFAKFCYWVLDIYIYIFQKYISRIIYHNFGKFKIVNVINIFNVLFSSCPSVL